MEQSDEVEFGLELSAESCGHCLVCIRSCPFEAIKEGEEVEIDPEACQYCGICASSCPAGSIKIFHYNLESLMRLVDETLERKKEISFACRANAEAENADVRLPCLGRLPAEILSYAFSRGAELVKLLPCEEDFCRFELGSRTLIRRAALLNSLFSQLNAGEIVIEKLSSRINYDAQRCISCGYCAFVCPYDALEFAAESTTVRVNEEKCMGCGRCVSICPVFALELEGFSTKSFEEMVSEALKQGARRIHFGCRWSDYERFDEMRVEGEDAFIPVVCSGFVSENLILHALCEGAQEVFVIACSGDDCRLKEGNRFAEERVEKLKKLLESIGVHEKVHLVSSSPKFILREGD